MESKNIALQGTLCTSGSGLGVCVGLGDFTVFGRIAKQASSERTARTTLEVEILRFVIIIAGMAFAVAVFIISEFPVGLFVIIFDQLTEVPSSVGCVAPS
jgi:sodium/potassium-transporting ATPase subunit alpha